MTHSFDVAVAQKHGLNPAIVLDRITGWIVYNKANAKNQHEGRTWTYNSVKSWAKLLPYLTLKQIRSALDDLRAAGLLMKGNFNANTYDRTCWYALPDESDLCPTGQKDLPEEAAHVAPQGKRLDQGIEPSVKPVTPLLKLEVAEPPDGRATAEAIYKAYPKKIAKAAALKAIGKALAKTAPEKLLTATLSYAAAVEKWPDDDKRFIPYPATWFNRGSYEDDPQNWTRSHATSQHSNGRRFEQTVSYAGVTDK